MTTDTLLNYARNLGQREERRDLCERAEQLDDAQWAKLSRVMAILRLFGMLSAHERTAVLEALHSAHTELG